MEKKYALQNRSNHERVVGKVVGIQNFLTRFLEKTRNTMEQVGDGIYNINQNIPETMKTIALFTLSGALTIGAGIISMKFFPLEGTLGREAITAGLGVLSIMDLTLLSKIVTNYHRESKETFLRQKRGEERKQTEQEKIDWEKEHLVSVEQLAHVHSVNEMTGPVKVVDINCYLDSFHGSVGEFDSDQLSTTAEIFPERKVL